MNIALWILQVLLAAQFLFHGWLFLAPPAELVDIMNANFSPTFRIFLGIAEVLAALALILPGITRIMTWATPLAAAGLMIVSGSASVYHLTRGETSSAIITAILFIMAAFVAYMRWKVKPIPARMARVH
jgi:uncharacterized membrane protein YphA (DoxX/SURF4 family)